VRITFLCSDSAHPVNIYLEKWISYNTMYHQVTLARRKSDLVGGDILFLISCSEILQASDRTAYQACLVLHASDLPEGRGWSPYVWAIINGAEELTLSLLEAEDPVDSGRIWKKLKFQIPKHALWNEINESLFLAEIELIDFAVEHFRDVLPAHQNPNITPSYYPRRTARDSRIDANIGLKDQFDLIRVCDPLRYPAFFDLHGHRYKLVLEKMDDQPDID
jgi:methionyl-tRNA formyltransferase